MAKNAKTAVNKAMNVLFIHRTLNNALKSISSWL